MSAGFFACAVVGIQTNVVEHIWQDLGLDIGASVDAAGVIPVPDKVHSEERGGVKGACAFV